jgi:uncharacterized protein (DUF1015 family)
LSDFNSTAYEIYHNGFGLEIALIETDQLLFHEETIPSNLINLVKEIKQDGLLKSPVIVDKNSLVILDGSHRTAALENIGCRFNCICLVDYTDPRITIGRWNRVISGPIGLEQAERLLKLLNIKLKKNEDKNKTLKNDYLKLFFRESNYQIEIQNRDLVTILKIAYELELLFKNEGFYIRYETDYQTHKILEKGSADIIMVPPKISKRDVLQIAKRKNLFAPKATCHKFPARTMGVNVPLSLLKDQGISVKEANMLLSQHLRKKILKKHTPIMGKDNLLGEVLYQFDN